MKAQPNSELWNSVKCALPHISSQLIPDLVAAHRLKCVRRLLYSQEVSVSNWSNFIRLFLFTHVHTKRIAPLLISILPAF